MTLPEDFYDDVPPAERPHFVYRIYSADDVLLYIGCAYDVEQRIYMHKATYTMVDAFLIHRHYQRHTSEQHPTLRAARAAERAAITAEAPLLNRQHNPKRWRRVDGQYLPVDEATLNEHAKLCAPPPVNHEFVAFLNGLFGDAGMPVEAVAS